MSVGIIIDARPITIEINATINEIMPKVFLGLMKPRKEGSVLYSIP
jgi:hypothetical protein